MNRTRRVCLSAIEKFGQKHQLKKAVEECTELSLAVQHFQDEKVTADAVIDEIADMTIMVIQLTEIFGEMNVLLRVSEKINRLERLIDTDATANNNRRNP
jgi:NTP pyrophosphatase (non-canonical NTP hydrolase)